MNKTILVFAILALCVSSYHLSRNAKHKKYEDKEFCACYDF